MGKSRLEAFSDGVLAVIITIRQNTWHSLTETLQIRVVQGLDD
jgi:hypothetical protein